MIYNKTQRHKENVQKRITRLEIRIPRPSIRDDVEGGNRETAGGTTERHREALHEQSRISRATGKGRSYSREYHVGGRHTTHPLYNKTGLARQLSLRTGIGAIDGVRAPTFIIRYNRQSNSNPPHPEGSRRMGKPGGTQPVDGRPAS